MSEEYQDRKNLTFEQAEGAVKIPGPLALKELSPELRARLWAIVYDELRASSRTPEYRRYKIIENPWRARLYHLHVLRQHLPADEFNDRFEINVAAIKNIIFDGDYLQVLGWLQWILRVDTNHLFAVRIRGALKVSGAAYRLLEDDKTIVPIGSEFELRSFETALVDLSTTEFKGARAHLSKAAQHLTSGEVADSIRESIHAVESVARVIEPQGDFSKALARLETKVKIHGGLKKGFLSIYGFTSDEKGIRHPLLDKGGSEVDETDALFMIGACAAFVSYLINKSRGAGILESTPPRFGGKTGGLVGFRFGKRIKIAPGLNLNISKRGLSVRGGVKGAGYSVGTSGHRVSAGIPGTGIGYSKKIGNSKAAGNERTYGPIARFIRFILGVLLCLFLGAFLLVMLFGGK
jgi:hypothetical protein